MRSSTFSLVRRSPQAYKPSRKGRRTLTALACLAAAALCTPGGTPSAFAQPKEAQRLYDEAVKHLDTQQYADACPKLEQVVEMVPEGLGAKLTLAECYEGLGRVQKAIMLYEEVEEEAGKLGQRDRVKKAGDLAKALRDKAPRLKLELDDAVRELPGLTIKLETPFEGEVGAEVSEITEGMVVDRGPHAVIVEADGYRSRREEVETKLGEEASVRVDSLKKAAEDKPVETTPEPSSGGGGGWMVPTGIVVGGLGIAGLGVGGLFGGLALGKQGDAEEQCNDQLQCTQQGLDLRDDARGLANVSTVLFIAGGVLTAAGVTLLILAPGDDGDERAGVEVRPGFGGLELVGRF